MRRANEQGSVLIIVCISLVVLLGMAALAIDVGGFRAHRRQLQSAADAGALIGAMQLPPFSTGATSCSRADEYQRLNSTQTDPNNMIVNANLDTSYCLVVDGGQGLQVRPFETQVPYVFGRVFGFVNTTISAAAQARVVYLTRSNGLLPFGVEDLRPKTVTLTIDKTGQQIPLGQSGCLSPTQPENYPYWCATSNVTNLPAGGSTVSLSTVDNSGKTITWNSIGYVATDQSMGACGCTAKDVTMVPLSPAPNPYLYYSSTNTPPTFTVSAHLTNLQKGDTVAISYDGGKAVAATAAASATCAPPNTLTDCVWTTPTNKAFTASGNESTSGQDIQVEVTRGKTTYTVTAQHAYARDDGDLLQQVVQSTHYVPAGSGSVTFNIAFQVLVKGVVQTLKLGGGGAQGNSGNYQGLDLDTNQSWPIYACYSQGGVPNTADEVLHGACTPYSIGDPVQTQTGNFAGQVSNGLDARIGNSPNNWTTTSNPPPQGDPRWMSLILVPPLTYANCNGNCTTTVVGFGSFYITDYGGSKIWNSNLKPGEVKGVFWDRPVKINQYSTSCDDPSGVACLASVVLEPVNPTPPNP